MTPSRFLWKNELLSRTRLLTSLTYLDSKYYATSAFKHVFLCHVMTEKREMFSFQREC